MDMCIEAAGELHNQILVERALNKSQPQELTSQRGLFVRRFATSDLQLTSATRTELTPLGRRVPSSMVVSVIGRRIILQNPSLLRDIFSGSYPSERPSEGSLAITSSGSIVRRFKVGLDGQDHYLVIKYHDEGNGCYGHYREGSRTKVFPDMVSGIDNFWALRAIEKFSSHLSVPKPIFGTRRVFVADFVEGDVMNGEEIPGWVKGEIAGAINKAYRLGWLRKPYSRFGIPIGFKIDIDVPGNVLRTEAGLCVVDPIL